MSKWTECYADKERTRERFACTGCETVVDASHKKGPPNGLCKCDVRVVNIGSKAYRENFPKIQWNKDAKKTEDRT